LELVYNVFPKSSMNIKLKLAVVAILFFILPLTSRPAQAASDPRNQVNNKVGIGLLSPESDIVEAAQMVNNNGDWGWVVIVIKRDERNQERWQGVFTLLNKNHLIPIVRIATEPGPQGFWQRPSAGDAGDWADFLSKLYWPTRNRYVQIYNEVNRADEWGGEADPNGYAKELEKTAGLLKAKSDDFFILNSALDLAASGTNSTIDAQEYLGQMNNAVPEIFAKIDGWASHSYPNPNFSANPLVAGRLGIGGYVWELAQIKRLGAGNLPVFITETGWRHGVGGLDENTIAQYYKLAFEKVWNDKNVVAVCPFVFNYPEDLFRQFSFKADDKILGRKYYNYYGTIRDLGKERGDPIREDKGDLVVNIPPLIIKGFGEKAAIDVRNNGNYIWNLKNGFKMEPILGDLKIENVVWEKEEVNPGEGVKASFVLAGDTVGESDIKIRILNNGKLLAERGMRIKNEGLLEWFFEFLK